MAMVCRTISAWEVYYGVDNVCRSEIRVKCLFHTLRKNKSVDWFQVFRVVFEMQLGREFLENMATLVNAVISNTVEPPKQGARLYAGRLHVADCLLWDYSGNVLFCKL